MDRRSLRSFGMLMGGIIAVLFGLLVPAIFSTPFPLWPWVLGGIFGFFALVYPAGLAPVYRGWMTFGHIMGAINSYIILGAIFCLLVIPIGVIMRLMGSDPLRLKKADNDTFFTESEQRGASHMKRPF